MKLGIAVLAYNQPHLVERMKEQLGEEMILVDNGSTVKLPYVKNTIRLDQNSYFAGGWHNAMLVLSQEYEWIAMLNSDIELVIPEMFYDMVESAEKGQGIAAVSPAFNSPHSHMHNQGKGDLRIVPWLDWTAVVMNTVAWHVAGGFRWEMFAGYGADLDLCYRLRVMGYLMAVDDRYTIRHLGSQTALAEGLQGIQGNVHFMNKALNTLYGTRDWIDFIDSYLA